MDTKIEKYYGIKVGEMYLEGVWEWDYLDEDEEINYSFSDKLSKAMRFYAPDDYAPKYLWDDVKEKDIETIVEASEYFKGEVNPIEKITLWKEITP